MRICSIALLSLLTVSVFAQSPKKKPKVLCNPLVLGQLPKKAISVQYEYQTSSDNVSILPGLPVAFQNNIEGVQGLRLNLNRNVVVKPTLYMSVDLGWWYSRFATQPSFFAPEFVRAMDGMSFHSITASSNIFKPLDERHFLLVTLAVELNGNNKSFGKLGAQNLFAGGGVFYGWKKGMTSMTAVGLLRAYRLGRVVHVPALLFNKSFNKKWGVEMLLPARALVRYTAGKQSFVTAGYDLEGGQFAISRPGSLLDNSFLQRGEIRPRVGYDAAIAKNWRITLNAGCRINGRFSFADNYDGKRLLLDNEPELNLFFNAGLHLQNWPKGKKKK